MYYSQFGEDRLLAKIYADKPAGVCMEVGANDGINGSTTLFFEQRGWECILIEPNPFLAARLRTDRTGIVFECAASSRAGSAILQLAEGTDQAHAVSTIESGTEASAALRKHGVVVRPVEVATRRLDDILEEVGTDRIDFISIDVEGHELEALKGLSLPRWRPSIMIVEDNSSFRNRAVRDHLADYGYKRFRRSGVNDWYARLDDPRFVGRFRRMKYLYSAVGASSSLNWSRFKGRLAAIPGVLTFVHALRGTAR